MSLISDSPNQQPDHAYRSACRIIELIETYQHSLKNAVAPEAADYTVTLIARSPLSPAAAALATKAEDLAAQEIGARIILAKPAPTEALQELIQALKPVLRGEVVSGRVRWARNPSLLDAHEQMTLGSTICWSGDAMRRSPQRPGVLEIAEEDSPASVRLAGMAFSALWSACVPLTRAQVGGEKRRLFDSLSEMALAVHRKDAAGVAIPSVGENSTRH
jgi:hypothetical protein